MTKDLGVYFYHKLNLSKHIQNSIPTSLKRLKFVIMQGCVPEIVQLLFICILLT